MQKIVPHLWFNKNAQDAVSFYLSVFPEAKQISTHYYPKEGLEDFQKEFAGKILTIEFELSGYRFVAINAGPEFSFNPSVSFMLNFDPSQDTQARKHLDELWEKLMDGGEALMPLNAYPFSSRYGWVKDKYGLSWQLILTNPQGEKRPFIVPSLMFCGKNNEHAQEAMGFYTSVFSDTKVGTVALYTDDTGPAKKGSLMFGDFMLAGQWFAAMDTGTNHTFNFNEAVSFLVICKDQEEIDYYWDILTKDGGQESVCGWLKDKYGLSWQVGPQGMDKVVEHPASFAKLMHMKKIIIKDL